MNLPPGPYQWRIVSRYLRGQARGYLQFRTPGQRWSRGDLIADCVRGPVWVLLTLNRGSALELNSRDEVLE